MLMIFDKHILIFYYNLLMLEVLLIIHQDSKKKLNTFWWYSNNPKHALSLIKWLLKYSINVVVILSL